MKHAVPIAIALVLATALPAGAGLGRADEETYRCTVTLGGGQTPAQAPNAGADTHDTPLGPQVPHAGVGGCQLEQSVLGNGVVTDTSTPEGCAAYADANGAPAPPGGDRRLATGDAVERGESLWGYCEAGVTEAEIEVTVDFS